MFAEKEWICCLDIRENRLCTLHTNAWHKARFYERAATWISPYRTRASDKGIFC